MDIVAATTRDREFIEKGNGRWSPSYEAEPVQLTQLKIVLVTYVSKRITKIFIFQLVTLLPRHPSMIC